MVKSGLTKDELISWGGEEVFNQALALCNTGCVRDAKYNDETLIISGKIEQPNGWEMPVSFKLEAQGLITSKCPCIENQQYGRVCPHVVAIGIAIWVMEMENQVEGGRLKVEERLKVEGGRLNGGMLNSVSAVGTKEKSHHCSTSNLQPSTSLESQFIEIPMKPRFFAELHGNKNTISIELDAHYGDRIEFPACSLQAPNTVYIEDKDDPLVRHVRSIEREREATALLRKWGFEPGYSEGDLRFYVNSSHRVLNFLGAGLPELRRQGWILNLSDALLKMTDEMPSIVPVITIRDAPNGDFDVRYSFDAMGEDISPLYVQAAINRNDGFIMNNGRVVLLDNYGIDAIREVFNDCASTQGGAEAGWFRVRGIYAGYVKSSLNITDCDVNLDDARQWQSIAQAQSHNSEAKFEPIALGKLDDVLRPYQKQGVYWMRFLENAGHSGLLADEMGLGKTLQTLTWITLSRTSPDAHGEDGRNLPALIVCPTSLVRNWQAEAAKFTPELKVLVVSGPERNRSFAAIPTADLVVTSYALLQRDFEHAYAGVKFSAVVLDEAQHIKNRQTRNAKSAKALNSVYRLVLTGTPVENSVADVWSIFDFLMPGYLGEYEGFRVNFEEPIASGENAEFLLGKLKRKIAPFIMRRLKKTVAKDLPDKIIKISYCPMSEEAEREYLSALRATRNQAGDIIREKGFAKSKFELLAMLMRLRMIASKAKVDTFMEQLTDAIRAGHKILVFSQFVKMLGVLKERLGEEGIPFCYLDGSTKDRLGECNRFNRTAEIPVFLISLMAGGTGLNLTGADMVMHYDPWWNPAVEDQATDRAHRIGQKKSVYVMKMIASGSIEEKVLALQRRKQAVIKATIDTTDAAVMEKLTAADLNELLSLA